MFNYTPSRVDSDRYVTVYSIERRLLSKTRVCVSATHLSIHSRDDQESHTRVNAKFYGITLLLLLKRDKVAALILSTRFGDAKSC